MIDGLLRWFSRTRLWQWLNKHLLSKLTFRMDGYPSFPMSAQWGLWSAVAEDAAQHPHSLYAFVSADSRTLSSALVRWVSRSKWTHAGWIWPHCLHPAPDLQGAHIVHMQYEGCLLWHLSELLRRVDWIAVVRIDLLSKEDLWAVQRRIGTIYTGQVPYDIAHDLDSTDSLDCSEFIFHSMRGIPFLRSDGMHVFLRPDRALSRPVFAPEDVYAQASAVVWERSA